MFVVETLTIVIRPDQMKMLILEFHPILCLFNENYAYVYLPQLVGSLFFTVVDEKPAIIR